MLSNDELYSISREPMTWPDWCFEVKGHCVEEFRENVVARLFFRAGDAVVDFIFKPIEWVSDWQERSGMWSDIRRICRPLSSCGGCG